MAHKKRHHQSMKSRVHESMGEERYEHAKHEMMEHRSRDGMGRHPKRGVMGGLNEEYYAGYDPRRTLEKRDGEMIFEDHGAIANLPPRAFQREWPRTMYESGSIRPDDIHGIDEQMDNDIRDIRSNRQHNKA